jgi:hypothetical protein
LNIYYPHVWFATEGTHIVIKAYYI